MSKKDVINNWYQKIKGSGTTSIKNDKNFNRHYIPPCSMITIVGPTGSGKSNALVEFLSRKNNVWYEIILFTGSTTDEPLYKLLNNNIPGIEFIDNPDALPDLTEYNEAAKNQEKLIIFDDIINLKKKRFAKDSKVVQFGEKIRFYLYIYGPKLHRFAYSN